MNKRFDLGLFIRCFIAACAFALVVVFVSGQWGK